MASCCRAKKRSRPPQKRTTCRPRQPVYQRSRTNQTPQQMATHTWSFSARRRNRQRSAYFVGMNRQPGFKVVEQNKEIWLTNTTPILFRAHAPSAHTRRTSLQAQTTAVCNGNKTAPRNLYRTYPDDSNVVAKVFPAELRPDAHLLADLEHLGLPLNISKGPAGVVPGGWQAVQIPEEHKQKERKVIGNRWEAQERD